jgi:hypothetical protein
MYDKPLVSPPYCKIALRKRKGSFGGKVWGGVAERVLIFHVAAGFGKKNFFIIGRGTAKTFAEPTHLKGPKRESQYHTAYNTVSVPAAVNI